MSKLALDTATSTEINQMYREYARRVPQGHVPKYKRMKRIIGALRYNARVLMLPVMVCAGLLMMLRLRISIALAKGRTDSPLHTRALEYVDDLVEQYPFGLYMILTKAIDMAFIKDKIAEHAGTESKIAEVAIGDGTFSARLFERGERITALEFNPYSLVKASRHGHVRRAVVCDGTRPPVKRGAFDLLMSYHFLSHVTQKETAITNWARASRLILFDECTPYWGTGMAGPYVLRKMGLRRMADKFARKIVIQKIEHLETQDELERIVRAHCELIEKGSFMNERTLFYCTVFTALQFMTSNGPTVPLLKKISLGPLRWLAVPLTRSLATLLIRFDAFQDRSTDAMVAFFARSRECEPADVGGDFRCPHCEGSLDAENHCIKCGMRYQVKDDMLFLLPKEFQDITDEYSSKAAAAVPDEQH